MKSIKEKVEDLNPSLWRKFQYCTTEITEVSDEEFSKFEFYSNKVKEMSVEYTEPYMIFIILAKLKEIQYEYQPMEKVLFVIPFKYNDHYCFFSMEKFGLKFGISINDEGVVERLFKKLNNAIKITDKLLSPIIEESVNAGEFTLENKSGILRNRYLFFRKNAQANLERTDEKVTSDTSSLVSYMNSRSKMETEALFNIQAMLDAYFSFQEHTLILLLPFCQFNKDLDDVTSLIGDDWTAKFSRIFKPHQNPELMKHFEKLRKIKELRNKYAHGGFNKKKKSLYVHVQGVGAIPAELPQKDDEKMRYTILSIHNIDFPDICKIIDEFEQFLYSTEWERPLKIVEAGIDIRYDDEYISQLQIATLSDENLEYFLKHESELYTRNANMDW